MMQMLAAGGHPVLHDDARPADAGNPRGYLELEAVKRLPADADWIERAGGHAVKVIHALVRKLPAGPRYRVVWMQRDLGQVVRSQSRLLERLGRAVEDDLPEERVAAVLGAQLDEVASWIDASPDHERLVVEYAALVADPEGQARRVAAFLGGDLDVMAMAKSVDATLHRER